jgi:hypothetical protein
MRHQCALQFGMGYEISGPEQPAILVVAQLLLNPNTVDTCAGKALFQEEDGSRAPQCLGQSDSYISVAHQDLSKQNRKKERKQRVPGSL